MLEYYNECRLLQKEVLEVEGLYREGLNSCTTIGVCIEGFTPMLYKTSYCTAL